MKFKSQNILTIISVALMLYFAGLYVIISWQSDYFMKIVKEKINLLIELEDGISEKDIQVFIVELDSMNAVKKGTTQYISKEEAFSEMENEFGEDFFLEDMENPFSDAIIFSVNSQYYQNDSLMELKQRLESETFVKELSYRQDIFEPMQENMNRLAQIVSLLGILLVFGALILIHNTLKLSLNSQRRLIKTMELVGAKSSFILKPFLLSGMLQGFISGFLASAGIMGTLYILGGWVSAFNTLYTTERTFLVLGTLIGVGMVIYTLISYFTVKRYLRLQMEDIF